jgi:uncharacterized protein YoxC
VTAGELALVVAAVLCIIGFAALALVLYRVLLALRDVQGTLTLLKADTATLVGELREALDDTRDTVEEARDDLERFDRVLGSAEAISANVEGASRVARLALSAPVIKGAALATGTRRTFGRLRRRDVRDVREVTR